MRFVHIEDFVHPDAGYQLNLLGPLQVAQGHEVIIITSEPDHVPSYFTSFFPVDDLKKRDEDFLNRTGVRIIRYPTYTWYSSRAVFKPKLHRLIKSLKPDVLFVHGEDTLTGMKLIWDFKRMKMPYVIDCHMLEMASVNKFSDQFRLFFRKCVTPHILKNNIPLIRVVNSDFVEKHYAIPLKRTKLLAFGTDTLFFSPNEENKIKNRKELGINEKEFVVMYAGKMDETKGGRFLAETLREKFILKSNKRITFLIIGSTPKNEYGNSIETIFKNSENVILRLPTQNYTQLVKFYQLADIAVYPKQCGMSYFEAQSCGLPVVLEINEINIERASNKKGLLFEEGSIPSFRDKIIQFANMDERTIEVYKKNARNNILVNYNYIPIAQEFTNVMINEYNRFHNIT